MVLFHIVIFLTSMLGSEYVIIWESYKGKIYRNVDGNSPGKDLLHPTESKALGSSSFVLAY